MRQERRPVGQGAGWVLCCTASHRILLIFINMFSWRQMVGEATCYLLPRSMSAKFCRSSVIHGYRNVSTEAAESRLRHLKQRLVTLSEQFQALPRVSAPIASAIINGATRLNCTTNVNNIVTLQKSYTNEKVDFYRTWPIRCFGTAKLLHFCPFCWEPSISRNRSSMIRSRNACCMVILCCNLTWSCRTSSRVGRQDDPPQRAP